MPLGPWGRILVMAVAALIVVLTVLIVVCFVGPGCWGFAYLQRRSRRKTVEGLKIVEVNASKIHIPSMGPTLWLNNNKDYGLVEKDGDLGKKGIVETCLFNSPERNFNSKCAPFPIAPVLGKNLLYDTPKLDIKLAYSSLNQDGTMGRLAVHLIEARSLPGRDYYSSLEPYLILEILNNKWSLSKNERVVHTVQTRIVRHTHNPKFDQTFTFDLKKTEVKDWCLKFTIYDNDRLTRQTPLCEKRIHLKEIKNLMKDSLVPITGELQEISSDNGELLFGVSYLPTAQRLSISVIKASRLKYLNVVHSLTEFYPFIRVLMVNNQGKCIKKKKTCFKHADDSPVFNETLAFDLPSSQLEHAVFLLLVCTKTVNKLSSSDGSPDMDENPNKIHKDKVLGTITLGRTVRCSKARDHWVAMMQNPRKVISVWQTFK